ncbi:MAG: competence/damage-inducible protein A [Candidatus Lokiarchaeota archaeon]|nr:competence/damage-inducible protein A [Candidatus Lokiarchaeota archaeon]
MKQEKKKLIAGILSIGDEVLDGLVLDTNSNWLELRLALLSVEVRRLISVRDQIDEIGKALDFLVESCNIIITSGGLGPTHDDMTLKAVARWLGKPLEENQKALDIVKRQYRMFFERGIVDSPDMIDSRRKMAYIPQGSVPLDNQVGGAPGVMVNEEAFTIFCLPGVPPELKYIFDHSVKSWLEQRANNTYSECIVEFPFRDESVFSPFLDKIMKTVKGIYLKSMPKRYGDSAVLRVWISARGEKKETLDERIDDAIKGLEKLSGKPARRVES